MTKGGYEVEAAVDSVVLDVFPIESTLVSEVLLKLVVDVSLDGPPAGRNNCLNVQVLQLFKCKIVLICVSPLSY